MTDDPVARLRPFPDGAETAQQSNAMAQLYMVIEKFKDAAAVYRRFREHGRLAPEGLRYLSSWTDNRIERCFQLMETDDLRLLNEWMAAWSDLVEFEVFPVLTSAQAAERTESLA